MPNGAIGRDTLLNDKRVVVARVSTAVKYFQGYERYEKQEALTTNVRVEILTKFISTAGADHGPQSVAH